MGWERRAAAGWYCLLVVAENGALPSLSDLWSVVVVVVQASIVDGGGDDDAGSIGVREGRLAVGEILGRWGGAARGDRSTSEILATTRVILWPPLLLKSAFWSSSRRWW
jgi:hypothetical protein